MTKHREGMDCPSCDEKLLQADLKLRTWFAEEVKKIYETVHVSCSYRDKSSQNEDYEAGRSKLAYPCSKHNVVDSFGRPAAKALDLFVLGADDEALFPIETFTDIADHLGPDMRWGGDFQVLRDYDHFELL